MNLTQSEDVGLIHHETRNFLDFANNNVTASRRRVCCNSAMMRQERGDTNAARDKQMLSEPREPAQTGY